MRRFIVLAVFCVIVAGCKQPPDGKPGDVKVQKQGDEAKELPAPVYEAVLRDNLKPPSKGEGSYLFVDGKDPAPELLKRLHKHWPELKPGSQVPNGTADRLSLTELKWIDATTAELRCGRSNGKDGVGKIYHLKKKDGEWMVDKAVVDAVS
jgi:hypothetical protein